MIRAFAAALEDDNLLVRRGALDLLLQSIRADSAAVKRAQSEDRVILMRAASGVVLRRDLSLNRRLYTWLLGSDEKSEQQVAFFKKNALELLKSTLKVCGIYFMPTQSEMNAFSVFRMKCTRHQVTTQNHGHSRSSYHYWTNGRSEPL